MLFTNWGLPGSKYLSLFYAYIVYLRNPSLLGYIYIIIFWHYIHIFESCACIGFDRNTWCIQFLRCCWWFLQCYSIISGLCLKKSVGLVYKALLISPNMSRKQPTLTTFDSRWVPQTGWLTSYMDPSTNSSICRSDNCNGWDNHFPLVMSKPFQTYMIIVLKTDFQPPQHSQTAIVGYCPTKKKDWRSPQIHQWKVVNGLKSKNLSK